MFEILIHHFWLLAIAVTFINAGLLKYRSKKMIAEKPELKAGYEKLFKGYLIFLNLPWVVMGIGMTAGPVADVFAYFRPSEGNPFVLAFYFTVVTIWVLETIWVLFRGGAEFMVAHPGVFRMNIKSPLAIKALVAVGLPVGVAGMILIWMNI